ncbi:MAG: hypothetical protein HY235_14225 [Acidobacteria bacterium]|nr:hypothetical protein [Acidobacteriota bacterium]
MERLFNNKPSLGFLSVPTHLFPAKHSNFSLALPGVETPQKPVLFPADVWVTEVWSYRSANFGGYQLYFQPCDRVRAYFFHLKDISDALKAAFEAGEKHCSDFQDPQGTIVKCQARVQYKAAAGEQAGISGDGAGVDFGMADFRIAPSGLADLSHYPFDYPYYVSPVEYYPSDLKGLFETKLASWDGTMRRTAEPLPGIYRQDVPGTAQGNWFFPGLNLRINSEDLTPHLALVQDYINPAQPVLSIGASVKDVRMGLYSFTPAETGFVNRVFREVTADGNTYCYDNLKAGRTAGLLPLTSLDGVLLVSMPSESTIRLEKQGAAGMTCESARPWQFTDNATLFERLGPLADARGSETEPRP